jgi:hypothetical protein
MIPTLDEVYEPHISFPFQLHLISRLVCQDPIEAWPENPLHVPIENQENHQPVAQEENDVLACMLPRTRARVTAKGRKHTTCMHRFCSLRVAREATCTQVIHTCMAPPIIVAAALGGPIDIAFDLSEVCGPQSAYNFWLVAWGGV